MEQTKLNTFIGFAIKARKAKLGVNAVKTLKKADVLIICSTASENTLKEAISLSKKLNAKLYVLTDIKLEDIVYKENCKLIAVLDKGLAKAIMECKSSHLQEYIGGLL